jgi:O-antigen/teichoic acid export membrane protein
MGPVRSAVPSLRSAFAWSFAGNVVNGFSAWAVLALVARLTSIESLGQYALAVAVASPVAMLAHLNLRMVLATDVSGEHSDADYFRVRIWSAVAGLFITAAIGLAWKPLPAVGLTIVLVGANFAVENVEDLYYAVMQRSERLDQVAKSMVLRGLLGIALIAALLRTFPAPAAAAGGMLLSRIITLFSYDLRKATASAGTVTAPGEVFRRAAPLGLTLMLVSFTSAIPRYVVEHWLGSANLGAFAAVMSFISVGSVIINALGQSATTRLARSFRSGNSSDFRGLALRLCGLAVGIGLTGALIAAGGGSYFLSRVYRPELAQYQPLLVQALLAGTIGYVAAMLGFVVSSTRRFTEQLPLLTLVALTSGLVSLIAVPAVGLSGSVLAVAAAAAVQIGGNLYILRRGA